MLVCMQRKGGETGDRLKQKFVLREKVASRCRAV